MTDSQGQFRVDSLRPGFYSAGDVLAETFDLSGPLPVTVTLNADGGTVRGIVENCGGATVVIVPKS